MKLVIVPPALAELQDAADHYALQGGIKLGADFVAEFERVANLLLTIPQLGSPAHGARRYFMSKFPYCVIYQVIPDEVRILAVAHQRRRPGYWRGRNTKI
ncbi:type II toxin-antitoxin system RelE/ParE family toxin [Rugamonas sp. FT82W]|uniref:Type II toxin-antitoxin system RelE/ParE family toxin n=1 Tax=Duganella vulcania TaxID=2692166 RepID=A0A845GD51_9BURK|nr:type II toxin-antitoxin system RelE/ParE family toxin [Duganella vulcania]MYM91126.1 type II toxin-antitoxin system RelE/ParE family toxin [Duganella vulcania]